MRVLGISAFYHDSAAALVADGHIVAAAQEERFTRKKHDSRFPEHAIRYCLEEGGVELGEIDAVVFYDKPFLKFERLLETYLAFAPLGFGSFRLVLPIWQKEKLFQKKLLGKRLAAFAPNYDWDRRLLFAEHHQSHAASAFFASPFEEAAVLTMDGVGEWATSSLAVGRGRDLTMLREIHFPHSLGLLYSAFTYYCGFRVNSGEYKLMGLAPYGEPKYAEAIRRELIEIQSDGSFRMDQSYFHYSQGLTMTSPRFHALFGGPPRRPESRLDQRHMDLAASIQKVCEEVVLRSARHAWELSGRPKKLVLAGGVALNCVANGRLLREGPFEDLWVQPAAGDAGGSLGAALFVWHQLLEKPRRPDGRDSQRGSLLGPSFTTDQILRSLARQGVSGKPISDE